MTETYTVELSDVEVKALHYVALDADLWIQNAIHERCRLAIEEMVADDIRTKLDAGLPISGTKDEMVLASTLPSAQERHDAIVAQISAGPPGT
jgi:hypothetical protein